MPQSLVLNLVTQSAVPPPHLQGYSLQQLFFDLVETVDPELGRVLQRDRQNRSYSLSALQAQQPEAQLQRSQPAPHPAAAYRDNVRLFPLKKQVRADGLQYAQSEAIASQTPCWWRISFLDDALFDHLIFLWNQLSDEVFHLGPASVKITRIAAELPGSHWAASCTYQDLYEQASACERDIHLAFVTPTAFEREGYLTPLPTADAVFQPLRKAWNRYSGLAFAPSLLRVLVPTDFNIQTETIPSVCHGVAPSTAQSAKRSAQQSAQQSASPSTGCTGHISFRIGEDGDPLAVKRINALADFTRYCGVGYYTRFGMGVVRRLSAPVIALHTHGTR